MKPSKPLTVCSGLRELKQAFNCIKDGTADDVNFCASAGLFTATKIANIESILSQLLKQTMRQNQLLQKRKRHPSPYQLKVGSFLKEGKTIQEAHRLARE